VSQKKRQPFSYFPEEKKGKLIIRSSQRGRNVPQEKKSERKKKRKKKKDTGKASTPSDQAEGMSYLLLKKGRRVDVRGRKDGVEAKKKNNSPISEAEKDIDLTIKEGGEKESHGVAAGEDN